MSAILDGPPEPKKFRIELPVEVESSSSPSPPSDTSAEQPVAGDAPLEGQSPAGPSSARSSNGSVVSNGSTEKDEDVDVGMTGNLLEMISKSLLGNVFKLDDLPRSKTESLSPSPAPSTVVPGAVAVAQSPAAQLFADDDWSWHRNPAAAIRSGGTNKQTPVWKYFVYNKAENLSRCIIGDCTYMLKGPHTSTLACHLKKHPVEYAEFQKLKVDYTRERHGGQLPPSPSSSSSAASQAATPKPTKPRKEPPRPDVNNLVSALRNQPPQTASPLPNLMQNLLGMNPLHFLMNQPASSSASVNPAQAANQMLQQAGLTVSASGQIMQSKKWRRDERRQRELESRLALALSASHVPLDALTCPLWRELLEAAQPKFTFPDEIGHLEQMIGSHHARLQQSIKSHVSSAKRLCLIVEGVKAQMPQQDEPILRLAVSATYPGYNGQKYEVQSVLLGFRPVAEASADAVTSTVEQIMSEYEVPMEKISRIVLVGMSNFGIEGRVFDKQLHSISERLLNCFTSFIDSHAEVIELRNAVFAFLFAIVTKHEALQALNKATGGTVELPLTEPFPVLADAVLKLKESLQMISDQGLVSVSLTENQWELLRAVCTAGNLFKNAAIGDFVTIDGAIPAIRNLVSSVAKDPTCSPIAADLKSAIKEKMAVVMNPDAENFDGTFLQATALNPQLTVVLSEEQVAYVKKALEKQLRNRMPMRSLGVDALLANVINQTKMNAGDLNSNPLYADLLQQAHERINQDRSPNRDRMAEAVVSSYLEEVMSGCTVENFLSPFNGRAFGNPFQPPLLYWQQAASQFPQLAELAQELLAIPAAAPNANRLLSLRAHDLPWNTVDVSLLVAHSERADRFERDLLLRANRQLLPKTY